MPHKQLVALAGNYYRELVELRDDEPGEPGIWQEMIAMHERIEAAPDGLRTWYGNTADQMLREEGLKDARDGRDERVVVQLCRSGRAHPAASPTAQDPA
ncbi:MAG: hypothetical protein B7Z02_18290, partial [Rhodobacterales bacterium 32-67-9]